MDPIRKRSGQFAKERAAKLQSLIHGIYRAKTEKDASTAYQRFQEPYKAKYPKAVIKLMNDEASLFTF